MKTLILLSILPILSWAQAFVKTEKGILASDNFELSMAIRDYAKINGKNLVLPGNFESEKVYNYGPDLIKPQNFDEYVSSVLFQAGYTVLEEPATNTLQVINSRDVRYMAVPVYKTPQEAPDTYAYIRYIFSLNHISSHNLSRNLRPFISKYGRIVDDRAGKILILNDTGKSVIRVIELLKIIDTPQFAKGAAEIEKINNAAKLEVEEDRGVLAVLQDQHILFIVVFSLIFGLIGFMARGYLIRRIEGGW